MRQGEIVHYGMLDNLYRFFPRKVTIQQFTPNTQDSYGEETVGSWVDVDGLIDLPCQIAPAEGEKQKRPDMTPVVYTHRLVIAGYYSEIQENYRAVLDDDTEFEIVKVEHDSQQKTTPLKVRLVI
jgi:hypothetical protein